MTVKPAMAVVTPGLKTTVYNGVFQCFLCFQCNQLFFSCGVLVQVAWVMRHLERKFTMV